MIDARIVAVRSQPLALPMQRDYAWRFGRQPGANTVVFEIETAEGAVGYGESSCDHPAAFEALGGMLAEYFVGRSAGEVEAILADVWTHGRWRQTPRFTSHILAGLETACWDVFGKVAGLPASAFLGGRVRDSVHFFGYVRGDSPHELAASAIDLVADGCDVLYLKAGRPSVGDDVDAVREIRTAVGPHVALRVDPNEAWDVPTAIDAIRRLEPFDPDWIEQPVSADDVAALARVRRSVGVKIAADQAVYTIGDLRRVLDSDAADVIVLGHHETAGLWGLRKLAFVAESYGVPINRHGCFESDLSTAAALQVLACIPNLTTGNQLMHPLLEDRLVSGIALEPRGASIAVPDAPGLGVEIDRGTLAAAVDRYRRHGPFPPSGSRAAAGHSHTATDRPGGEAWN